MKECETSICPKMEVMTRLYVYDYNYLHEQRKQTNYGSYSSTYITLVGSSCSNVLALVVRGSKTMSDNRGNCPI